MINYIVTNNHGTLFIAKEIIEEILPSEKLHSSTITRIVSNHCPSAKKSAEYGVALGRRDNVLINLKDVYTLIHLYPSQASQELSDWLDTEALHPSTTSERETALKAIESLTGCILLRDSHLPYKCSSVRIDGYDIKNNVAYIIYPRPSDPITDRGLVEEILTERLGCTVKNITL